MCPFHRQGQICGLVGNNGAGKTTLMRMITGTSFWDSGSLILFGKEQNQKATRERKRLGTLLETPVFLKICQAGKIWNITVFSLEFRENSV